MSKKSSKIRTALRAALSTVGLATTDAEKVEKSLEASDCNMDDEAPESITGGQTMKDEELQKRIGDAVAAALKARDEEEKKVKDEEAQKAKDAEAAEAQKAKDAETAAAAEQKAKDDAATAEEKTGDTIIEAEGPGATLNLGRVYTGDAAPTKDAQLTAVTSRAEILAPGITLPTKDSVKGNGGKVLTAFMRDALTKCQTRDADGKACVDTFLMGRTVDALKGFELIGAFNGAATLMQAKNNRKQTFAAVRTGDFGGRPTNDELNKTFSDFWKNGGQQKA